MNNHLKSLACAVALLMLIAVYPSDRASAGIGEVEKSLTTGDTSAEGGTNGKGAGGSSSGVVMAGVLNVRSGAWGTIKGTLKQGAKVDIVSKQGSWYLIKYEGGNAYVHSAYVTTAETPASANDGFVNTPGTYLNVRTGPWGTIIGRLNHGASIETLGKQGDWYKIKYNGREAYIHSDYISKSKVSGGGSSAPSNDGGSSGGGNPSAGFGGRPVSGGRITSDYGPRNLFGHSYHYGIDFGVGTGTPLKALGPGRVVSTGYDYGGGKTIVIKYDNGYTSIYCHCKSASVSPGQRVTAGQNVGQTNNTGAWTTGPHLHFAMKNSSGNYVNPRSVPGVHI